MKIVKVDLGKEVETAALRPVARRSLRLSEAEAGVGSFPRLAEEGLTC